MSRGPQGRRGGPWTYTLTCGHQVNRTSWRIASDRYERNLASTCPVCDERRGIVPLTLQKGRYSADQTWAVQAKRDKADGKPSIYTHACGLVVQRLDRGRFVWWCHICLGAGENSPPRRALTLEQIQERWAEHEHVRSALPAVLD